MVCPSTVNTLDVKFKLKSVHNFGCPGKNSPGPDLAMDGNANVSVIWTWRKIQCPVQPLIVLFLPTVTNYSLWCIPSITFQTKFTRIIKRLRAYVRSVSASSICRSAPFFFTSPCSNVLGYLTRASSSDWSHFWGWAPCQPLWPDSLGEYRFWHQGGSLPECCVAITPDTIAEFGL